jgi:predicted P-loop ATPase
VKVIFEKDIVVQKKLSKNKKPFNALKTYLTAKIKSVSPFGTIIVKFSENIEAAFTNNISEIFN